MDGNHLKPSQVFKKLTSAADLNNIRKIFKNRHRLRPMQTACRVCKYDQPAKIALPGYPMRKSFWCWTSWFLFLFLLDFTLPFAFLKKIPTVMGSFLFWLIWIVVAVISMFIMFLPWQDNESQKEQ